MSTQTKGFHTEVIDESILVVNTGKVLDNNNAHEMFELISNAQAEGWIKIVVDMRELEFLSSAGVGALLGTVDASRGAGGDIILSGVTDNVFHILDVLDLTTYLKITEDLQKAQETFIQANE